MKKAEIHTQKGIMKIEFYKQDAPKTVQNFIDLAEKGFYDGLTFHRVIPNFVIQGGCPDGTGAGGPGYAIDCEASALNLKHSKPGVFSMANAGKNTGGSQFFLTTIATPWLDGNHAVFGESD